MSEFAIEIRQLMHRYTSTGPPAVAQLDLTVATGEVVGLLGPNGAGKTTTLHAVLGLLKPTAGDVQLFGCSPLRQRDVLRRVNFASVDVDLPSNLTVRESLGIFAKLYGVASPRRRIEELMQQFDLASMQRHLFGTLSAGERMRVKLCKALLNAPELLVLDEPTLSLDPYRASAVRSQLQTIRRERRMAILHTSHNMQEVEAFCDRIVFLHQGRQIAEGPPRQVLERFHSQSLDELFIRVATSGELYTAPGEP
jgi:ABC-2 type transport system ATP-binding protein